MTTKKKKVLHIANENSLGGGIGTVIDYLMEGLNSSEEFSSDTFFTNYSSKNFAPLESTFYSGEIKEKQRVDQNRLESMLDDYDLIHVHGIPNYGVLESLKKVKSNVGKKPKIINTAHSSVKQEFQVHYEKLRDSQEVHPSNKEDFENLDKYLKKDMLNVPGPFADTYWGSAINRQEQIMTMSDAVQHMNEAYKNSIIQEYMAEENAPKHFVIPNGVKTVKSASPLPKKKRLLYVGRFGKEKGIDELVGSLPYIFEEHPDTEIRIVGGDKEGKITEKYRKKTENLMRTYFEDPSRKSKHNLEDYLSRIKFTGWIGDKKEIEKQYRWSNYVIIPSKYESFSLTAAEALMHGRIPIITQTPAMDDLYVSKNIAFGIKENMRNPRGIYQTVSEIFNEVNSEGQEKMAEEGKKYAKNNYSYEAMILNQKELYKSLLEK